MTRSNDDAEVRLLATRARATAVVALGLLAAGCNDVPSKTEALASIQQSVQVEVPCTLPIATLSRLKMQHASKAVCVPREGGATNAPPMACLDALAKAGATKPMPASYMAEWPDEVAARGFDAVSPYERNPRNLIYRGCVEMVGDLRNGQFKCGEAHAEKIVAVTKKDETHALVRYARTLKLDEHLTAIDAACGKVSRPAVEETATFEKVEKRWAIATDSADPAAPTP